MSFSYTQTQLLNDINSRIHGKIGMISNQTDFANRVARTVHNDVAIRSSRRRADLTPQLFPGIFQYACPSDVRDYKIIDIPAQAKRYDGRFTLVPVEQFNVHPDVGQIAIDDYNGIRTLLINSELPAAQNTISELDTLTSGGGTWEAFGDATNVVADNDNYIKGYGSVNFDINADGNTTAGIVNTSLNTTDLSDFFAGDGAVFAWVHITSTTNLTNFVLRLGSDASNYYSKTVTARHDGNAFENGWNLLRFDLTNLTETGTPVNTGITYSALYMTKDAAKVSETDYKFDWLVAMRGARHYVTYISKYPWQSAAGVWKANSSDPLDVLVADESEYELFVQAGEVLGLAETKADDNDRQLAKQTYQQKIAAYAGNNPDESQVMISTYHYQ